MRTPKPLDAMARWLVLTLAGVGLFALVPGSSFAAPSFASTRWLLALHPVQLVAVAMITLAWVLYVVHILLIPGPWWRDPSALVLAALALASVAACVVALTAGSVAPLLAAFVGSIAVHVGLCVRIELVLGWVRGTRPAP